LNVDELPLFVDFELEQGKPPTSRFPDFEGSPTACEVGLDGISTSFKIIWDRC
jgi:hypothetical protein